MKDKKRDLQNREYSDVQEWLKDEDLTEEEMEKVLSEIENSAKNIKVPESLEPEHVKARIRSGKSKSLHRRAKTIAAAAALLVIVSGSGIYGMMAGNGGNSAEMAGGGVDNSAELNIKDDKAESQTEADDFKKPAQKKSKVGSYRLAGSYDDVYAAVEAEKQKNTVTEFVDGIVNGAIIKSEDAGDAGGMMSGGAEAGAGETDGSAERDQVKTENAAADEGVSEDRESAGADSDFSGTNTQVEGVDESDFIKNDGSYLYLQSDYKVSIVDIRGKKMKLITGFVPEMEASDTIADMYVDGNKLFLIVQKRDTAMTETSRPARTAEDVDVLYKEEACDEYYFDTSTETELQTYDISDRSNVRFLGAVTQDGSYYDSRKVGDYVYLFSRKETYGVRTGSGSDGLIPEINGEKVSAGCIYVQDNAYSELIISSVRASEPDKTVDEMVLLNQNASIYMSTEAIYLYSENYEWTENGGKSYTDIAKFSYRDGYMNGVAATNVRGTIQDVFAISESGGILRVLTTDRASDASKNQLYLLSDQLKLLGSLTDIATGEEIYAARYIGNVAYFITYHNTDPLFAVDISDPSNPKMLGQVEITGFSDYLHPYGDSLLVGIGYETDPETSERLGVKLVMFDVTDPTDPKIADSAVFEGSYCSAADYYKCALVSESKNLIGFNVMDWNKQEMSYKLYGWNGKKLEKRFSAKIDTTEYMEPDRIRGLYTNNRFYLVTQKGGGYRIQSYDMNAEFESLGKLVIE